MEYEGFYQSQTAFDIEIKNGKKEHAIEIDNLVNQNLEEIISLISGDFTDIVDSNTEYLSYVQFEVNFQPEQDFSKLELY